MRTQCCQPVFGSPQCNDCPLTVPLYPIYRQPAPSQTGTPIEQRLDRMQALFNAQVDRAEKAELSLSQAKRDAERLQEWSQKVRLIVRGIDAQAERMTHQEKTTWRDGEDQGEHPEDFEEIIHGYKLNTGLWHRLLGLLSSCPTPESDAALAKREGEGKK